MKITSNEASTREIVGAYTPITLWVKRADKIWVVSEGRAPKESRYSTFEDILQNIPSTEPIYEGDSITITF